MKTEEIIGAIKTILSNNRLQYEEIKKLGAGGDHDTEKILIIFDEKKELFLQIFGFTMGLMTDVSNWRGTTVVIEDGMESEGGMTHDEGDIVPSYHLIKKYFKEHCFGVVNTINGYF